MLADIGYELAPLEMRILEHANDARAESGLEAIGGQVRIWLVTGRLEVPTYVIPSIARNLGQSLT